MAVKHLDYRGDIQIYRAIAVLQVLLFHMALPGFAAGFLGVDIFFVISGYLMFMLYTDKSTPAEFYLRRARRLMPAYFAVIMLTLFSAFWLTIPTDFNQVAQQAIFGSLLSSNIGFWLQNSYFSKSEFNPLLHLWSLGVECQFYLIFPLIIFMNRRFRYVLPIMIGGSLLTCFVFVMISPKLSFFMVPLRLWEFGIGMWAASRPKVPGRSSVWGVVGLIGMLVIPLLPVQGEQRNIVMGHPGLAALLVSCATASALISRQPLALVRSLPGRGAQVLGNVSYSLYLAHWPVLVLVHYVPFGGTVSGVSGIGDLLVNAALIAVATAILFRLFERPGPQLFTPWRTVVAAVTMIAMCLLLPMVQIHRFDAADARIFAAWTDRSTYRCGKIFRVLHPTDKLCQIGAGDRGVVLLIGDSHSDAIKQAFAQTASQHGLATLFAVDNNPLITTGLDGSWLTGEVEQRGVGAIFLHYSSTNITGAIVDEARRAAAKAGVRLFLILPAPEYIDHVPQQLYRARHDDALQPHQDIAAYRRDNAEILKYSTRLRDVGVLAPVALFCAPDCRVTDAKGRLLYFDAGHLTLTGAKMLQPLLSPVLRDVAYSSTKSPAFHGVRN